jgi:type II secretory pathway component GspD/PulD (secretin)
MTFGRRFRFVGRMPLALLLTCLLGTTVVGAAEPEFVGALAWAVDDEGAKRLNLTEEQRTKLNELIDEREGEAVSLAVQLKDASNEDREAKLGPFRKESEAKGMAVLTEEQRKTLEQIRLEKQGAAVLADPQMSDKFKLTPEQRQEIAQLIGVRNAQLTTADERKAAQLREYYDKQIVKVLDDAQRAEWEKIAPAPAGAAANAAAGVAPPGGQIPVGQPLERTPRDPEGKLRFNFRFQPWADVLDWFAYQADLSLVMDTPPPGTFNYSDTRSYTPSEAIDLLNSVLLTKGYTVIKRDRMLMVINLEDGIHPNLISDVPLSELENRGEYEIVSVVFKLDRMTPEEAEQEIRRVLGPQGSIVTFPKSGYIRVTETAGRLRMIRNVLHGIDDGGAGFGSLRVFTLKHAEIDDVMNVLRQLLDIPSDAFASTDGSVRLALDPSGKLLVTGKPEKVARVEEVMKVVDVPFATNASGVTTSVEMPQLHVYAIVGADPTSVLQVLQTLMANAPDVRLAIDPKTGSLIALARPTQHKTIKATIEEMQGDAGKVEVIRLSRVDPQTAVLAINKLFGGDTAAGAANAPKVDADLTTRQLLVRASESQLTQIRSLLEKMGETSSNGSDHAGNGSGNVRMIPLSGRTARTALEQIEQLWPSMRQNRIRVVTPSAVVPTMRLNGEEPLDNSSQRRAPVDEAVPARAVEPPPKPQASGLRPKTDRSAQTRPTSLIRFAKQVEAQPEQSDAASEQQQQPPQREGRQAAPRTAPQVATPGEAGDNEEPAPIIVAPGSGGVMIASEDIEALNEFEALLSSLASRQFSGGKQYTIFYLTNANASTVAETLEQIFAGGVTSSSGGSLVGDLAGSMIGGSAGGLVGSLLSLGSSGPLVTGPVQIIPETRLNALIVEAAPADLDTVENLLKILDQGDVPETQVSPKPRLIPVQNSSASQIADIVKEVYQERLAGASRQRQPSPEDFIQMLRGGSSSGSRGSSSSRRNPNDQLPKMTIGVDERTNSLIVSAPNALFEEVRQLVETLDQATSESNTAVKVVTMRRSNPATVQKALTAIAGEKVKSQRQGESSSSSSSSRDGGSRDGGSRSSGDSSFADQMRQRAEFFNSLRGGSSGSSSGDRPSFFGGSRDGGSSRSFGGGFPFGGSRDGGGSSRDGGSSRSSGR